MKKILILTIISIIIAFFIGLILNNAIHTGCPTPRDTSYACGGMLMTYGIVVNIVFIPIGLLASAFPSLRNFTDKAIYNENSIVYLGELIIIVGVFFFAFMTLYIVTRILQTLLCKKD